MSAQPTEPKPILPWQVKRIKIEQKRCGIDDETYREMLAQYEVDSCTKLNYYQALDVISALEGRPVKERNQTPRQRKRKKDPAPKAMIRMLRFYMLYCGIHYAAFRAWSTEDGHVMQGEELRQWLKERFARGRVKDAYRQMELPIPEPLLRFMYANWINRRSNEFLVQGGYLRQMPHHPDACFYDELSVDAIEYLTNRYRAMHTAIEQGSGLVQVPIDDTHTATVN